MRESSSWFHGSAGSPGEEVKYYPSEERGDPAKIPALLQELYGCTELHVAL